MTSQRQPVSFIATDAPETARRFYEDVIGLTFVEASPFALVFSDGGQVLRIQIVPNFVPVAYTVHGWQVADIAAEMATLAARGVVFEQFEQLPQDADGVWTTPDGHKIAWFKDPSGNLLSLSSPA